MGPPSFDVIYVKISAWDDIKASLALLGSFKSGKGIIPESQYQAFDSESDFLGAWVFEGDYRDLITTLAQHELRQDLISGLNRHDNIESMMVAYLLASVDVVGNVANPKELASAIQQQAIAVYAVPPSYHRAESLANSLADMFLQLDPKERASVSGPSWVRKARYDDLVPNARATHPKYPIVIDQEGVVRMLWSHV
jgi:hypothetical protein